MIANLIIMKHITKLIVLIVSTLLFLNSCTTLQKDEAKQYALQIVKEVGKSAGIAAATVATDLTKLKLSEAEQKLLDQIAAAGPKNPVSASALAKLKLQLIAVRQAQTLVTKAEAEIDKLGSVDALPAPAPEVTVNPTK